MITFNNIVERFEDFATSHFFIKSFSFGSPDDVDLAKFTEFPLMHLVYTGATYDTGTKTYNIEVYILDVPADKTDKVERQREVVSDAEQCAEDIIADIRMGGNIFTFAQDYEVVNATTTPLEEETKNVLSGVLLDLSVAIPYEWDACNAPIDGVSPEGGDEPSYARRGFLRMLTLDGSTDVLSVRTIKVTNGTLTDDGEGVVTLNTGGVETLDDLTDVDIISPDQGDVLSYNSGVQKWMVNGGLQELLARFKASGTGAQVYDTLNDTTKGYIDILANSAKMKVNLSGLTVTEASPGVMSFSVAAGTEGNELEFEAMTIEGSDAVSTVADINFKQGALTYWENSTGKIWLRAPNVGNITVLFPSSGGTLALTTDIPNVPVDSVNGQTGVVVLDTGDIDENGNLYYTEARVAANAAVAANTAKVGITTQQAADITANNAKVGITPTQAGEITANTAKVGVIAGGTTGQALVKATGTDYDVEWADIAIDTQYHDRFQTDAETFRSGATATTELYYTAKADGDGLAQSASSDTPTAGKVIRRKIYYSEAAFADPDTGTWVEFTPAPADDASFATVKAALLEYLKARTGGTVPISLKQTWEEVTAAPTFTGLLNESYGSGAAAAFGTRRLNGNYSGDCMTIRRASDGTTQAIGFVGEEIDESAITTFCTGTTCTVQTWHDQSQTGGTGSGNDATQTTPANQPTIYTGGALVKEGGRLALFDGHFENITGISKGTNWSSFETYKALSTDTNFVTYAGDSNPNSHSVLAYSGLANAAYIRNLGSPSFYIDGVSETFTTMADAYTKLALDKVIVFSLINGNNSTWDAFYLSNYNNGTFTFDGYMQEQIFYASDKSTDRTNIEGNISAYYQSAKLLDEQFGENAEAAYSTRQLRRDQTDCMVIRRASDSTTTTIGFDSNGNIDEAAITTFCSGTSCTVYQWIDQSGNGNTATAAAQANEPTIYTGGALVKENGKVAVEFDGSNDILKQSGGILNGLSSYSLFSTFNPLTSATAYEAYLHQAVVTTPFNNTFQLRRDDANDRFNPISGQSLPLQNTTSSINNLQLLVSMLRNGATTNKIYQSGTFERDLTSNSYTIDAGDFAIGGRSNDVNFASMKAQEFVIYGNDKSTDRTSIESNVGDYFTQNTPLLDTYSGAAAAYSLRKLSSSYSGNAIRVRRASDNAESDIGFNVFGELSTVSLAAFCGSSDGFVKTWYCQSGNANDATQTNTASQPKIYDSTTGVVTENGKPAVQFDGSNDLLQNSSLGTNQVSEVTIYAVFHKISGSDNIVGWSSSFQSRANTIRYTTSPAGYRLGWSSASVGTDTGAQLLFMGQQDGANGIMNIDGTSQGTFTMETNRYWDNIMYIGKPPWLASPQMKMSEFVMYWSVDSASEISGIESNINTFYSIY